MVKFLIQILVISSLSVSGCTSNEENSNKVENKKTHELAHEESALDQFHNINLSILKNFYTEVQSEKSLHANLERKKPIILFLIDTLRNDYVTRENAPFITSFLSRQDVSHFQKARSVATSTAHSLFGLYWGMLPHTRYQLIDESYVDTFDSQYSRTREYAKGSPFLALLKKVGYQIETFGYQDIDFCVGPEYRHFQDGQILFLQLNYSLNSRNFLNYCDAYKRVQTGIGRFNSGLLDYDVLNRFLTRHKSHLPSSYPKVSIIRIQGVHHPYGWISKNKFDPAYLQKFPFRWQQPSKLIWGAGPKNLSDKINIENSYKNAVRAVDHEFWRLITLLEQDSSYDQSIILLASDHGHALMDLNVPDPILARSNGHGYLPYTPLTNTLFAIKWLSGHHPDFVSDLTHQIASLSDFFPTVLDYLEIESNTSLKSLPLYGESLFHKTSSCEITFQPTYDYPVRKTPAIKLTSFTIDNGNEKFFLKLALDNKNNYKKTVSLISHTDENDNPIDQGMGKNDLEHYINAHFSSCLSKMFTEKLELESLTSSNRTISSLGITSEPIQNNIRIFENFNHRLKHFF